MRPINIVLALVLALCSNAALALGLGDIRVLSKPGQPLVAEIPIISSDPGELEQARVALASPATFERVGLAPPQGLVSELQFQFAQDLQGRAVIRVTSIAPVEVPALGFLIEVDWGQGRLVREYSALVEAPETATAVAAPLIEAPAAAPSNLIIRDRQPAPATAAVPAAQPPQSPASGPRPTASAATPATSATATATGADHGTLAPVRQGQTLSQIAGRLARENGHSLDQTMAALLQANPEAFIRGNMHLLKQGAVLRSPRQDELALIDAAQARAIVQQQTAQWRQARAPIPQPAMAAAAAPPATTASAATAAGARLEIAPAVAAADKSAATTSGLEAGGEGDMLANEQLRQAKEDLVTRDGELQDLRERVAELEKLQKQQQALIAMKDSDLAAAQKRLSETPAASDQAGTPAWLWIGLVLLVLAGGAWLLARRRKPSPLPPLPRRGFDSAELAASLPVAATAVALDDAATDTDPAQEAESQKQSEREQEDHAVLGDVPQWVQPARAREPVPGAGERREPILLFEASRAVDDEQPGVTQTELIEPHAIEVERVEAQVIEAEWVQTGASAPEAALQWPETLAGSAAGAEREPVPEIDADPHRYVTDDAGQWRDVASDSPSAPGARERLELAIAYMDLGDAETARTLLDEVVHAADPQASAEASELLERLR